MANTLKLLKQIARAIKTVDGATDNPEFKALLGPAQLALNELMLQQSLGFYLNHLAAGEALLNEGIELACARNPTIASQSRATPTFGADVRAEAVLAAISDLEQCLLPVLDALDEARSLAEKSYLVRVCDWRLALYRHSLEQVPVDVEGEDIGPERLLDYLKRRFPEWPELTLTRFEALAGGFSKKTILFETHDAVNGMRSFVMRAEQPVDLLGLPGSDVTREFPMIQLMQRAGLPVAEPLWLEADRSQLGARFLVSSKAAGRIMGTSIGSDSPLSPQLIDNLIATLIQMHSIKIDADDPLVHQSHLADWLPFKTVSECTRYMVTTQFKRLLERCDVPLSPDLLRVLKWLERNVPECDEPPVVIHFDFALNNLLIEDDRLVAVLDWESSRLADPAEDLIWTQQNLAAYITMPALLDKYAAATGRRISEFRLAYARVLRCALNALCCLSARRALDAQDAAHLYLAILAYKYIALFGAQFNELIEAAERVR